MSWMAELKLLHLNVNELTSNIQELRHLAHQQQTEIIFLNETKLDVDEPPSIHFKLY